VAALPAVPRPVVRRLSSRYIAGPTLDDAAAVVRRLNGEGKLATVDVLGEEITTAEEAAAIVDAYRQALARIDGERLDANVSVKLTGFGLDLDDELVRRNLFAIVEDAGRRDRFVRVDMEDSTTTTRTLRLVREVRAAGHENVGAVVQAYLRRTIDDLPGLENVRLCKGIYVESPAIAYREYEAVRANYRRCLEALVEQGSYVAIATHDEALIAHALDVVRRTALPRDRYEFQMLLGVRPERGDSLVADGHRVRVYVPYGQQWYEYSVRRLQENPAVAGRVARDTVSRLLGRR
jgi:proline dehydrogenase